MRTAPQPRTSRRPTVQGSSSIFKDDKVVEAHLCNSADDLASRNPVVERRGLRRGLSPFYSLRTGPLNSAPRVLDNQPNDSAIRGGDWPAAVPRSLSRRCHEDLLPRVASHRWRLGPEVDDIALLDGDHLFRGPSRMRISEDSDIVVPPRFTKTHAGQGRETFVLTEVAFDDRNVYLAVTAYALHPLRILGLKRRVYLKVGADAMTYQTLHDVSIRDDVRVIENQARTRRFALPTADLDGDGFVGLDDEFRA